MRRDHVGSAHPPWPRVCVPRTEHVGDRWRVAISEVDVHLYRGCAIAATESLASCRFRNGESTFSAFAVVRAEAHEAPGGMIGLRLYDSPTIVLDGRPSRVLAALRFGLHRGVACGAR